MSLTRLRYFVVLAEELSFTKAAARLHMSQPPLTQQIRILEKEMGQSLFRRGSRQIALTVAGEALLPEARLLLDRYQRLPGLLGTIASGEASVLTIGCVASAMIGVVPHLLREFALSHTNTSLRPREALVERQLNQLKSGDLDAGLFRSGSLGKDWRVVDTPPDLYCVALPADHPLAQETEVEWSQLEDELLIMANRSRAPLEFDSIVSACASNGFRPRMIAEEVSGYNLIALVAGGRGVAVVPERVTPFAMRGVVYRPLVPAVRAVPLVLAVHRDRWDPTIDSLAQVIRQTPVPTCRGTMAVERRHHL